jgi:hypothetical protein
MVGWCCMCRNAGETGSHLLVTILFLQIYGARSYAPLGFFGCSLIILLIFFLVGIIILGNKTLWFGIWCLYA